MADLSLKVGALEVRAVVSDTNALSVIEDFVFATGGPVNGTAKQKMLFVLERLIEHLSGVASRRIIESELEKRREEIAAEQMSRKFIVTKGQ